MKNKRLTFDLTEESKEILEELKNSFKKPFGKIINDTLNTFYGVSEDVRKDITEYFKYRIDFLMERLKGASLIETDRLKKQIHEYEKLLALINKGENYTMNSSSEKIVKEIQIKNGYVTCPADWIILNPEEAENCNYAGVVECRRSEFYGIPHFLFFTDKLSKEYNNELYDKVQKMCCEKWPQFADIIDKQVEPVYDAERRMVNTQDYMEAPIIGYFGLDVEQIGMKLSDFPFGAKIVRN